MQAGSIVWLARLAGLGVHDDRRAPTPRCRGCHCDFAVAALAHGLVYIIVSPHVKVGTALDEKMLAVTWMIGPRITN